jgi:hypothetical protein
MMLEPTDPAAIAELQFKNATADSLPAARRALIAAHKLTVKALDHSNPNCNIPDESWTPEEVEAANQILRTKNLGTIIKEDTAMWDLLTHTSQKIMVIYATPACHWIPAIVKAAALRIKGIEEKVGKAEARKLFAPPFVVTVIGHSGITFMMVPVLVRDLQPGGLVLGPELEEAKGLIPVKTPGRWWR